MIDIPLYEGLYAITEQGEVFSYSKKCSSKNMEHARKTGLWNLFTDKQIEIRRNNLIKINANKIMKKLLLIIALFLTISGMAQENEKIRVARLAVKTAIEAEEKAKFETNFIPINIDSLITKRGVIWIGKQDSTTGYYLKVGNKNYKINSWDCNLNMKGETYNLRTEDDTIKCYGNKGVVLFSIQ